MSGLFYWCPEQDSNLHIHKETTPSKWRVYQFHHLGNGSANIQRRFEKERRKSANK